MAGQYFEESLVPRTYKPVSTLENDLSSLHILMMLNGDLKKP